MSGSTVALETALLTGSRLCLFFACRKYLLRNLYHDLQDLSAHSSNDTGIPLDDTGVELDTLPTSTTTPSTRRDAVVVAKRPFHSTISRAMFSLCFSESCTMFLLLMCQAIDIFHVRARLLNWNISLSLLLAAILVLIPLSYSLVLSDRMHMRQRPSALRVCLNMVPVGLFLFFLSYIPLPSALPSANIVVTALSRLTVLGTIILGALSGFGAINTAWTFFPVPFPTEEDVRIADDGLRRIQHDLLQRRADVQKLEAAQQPDPDASWFSKMVPSFSGDPQLSSVRQELSGLEALEYQMSRNLEQLKQRQADAKFARTLAGKAFNWGGRLFALYCAYRIINSILNLLLPSRRSSNPEEAAKAGADMISMGLAYLVGLLPSVHIPPEDVAVISRQISLALVGVIILSSLRLVLRGVARVLRVTSRNLGASLMLLILAQLMGIYLLSTLVQLRTSFPPPPVRPDTGAKEDSVNLFSTLPEYQLFGALFDGSFLIAAGASALVRWFSDRINNAGSTD
ncbi:hypothetical protein IEO21_05980 [Rhodonia placenta]|uniref:Abscisic acid G-protein coupled receptor-like domain-containing protein n=1 Tax=Rhodonia placenta TaxID=104341 RepID=A0A8H7P0V0_9APHY|nr:hypothetical protein IEO21_05980 [Postia placenta]